MKMMQILQRRQYLLVDSIHSDNKKIESQSIQETLSKYIQPKIIVVHPSPLLVRTNRIILINNFKEDSIIGD